MKTGMSAGCTTRVRPARNNCLRHLHPPRPAGGVSEVSQPGIFGEKMANRNITISLAEAEIEEIDRQAEDQGLSRSAAIGRLIRLAAPRTDRERIKRDRRAQGRPPNNVE